MVNIPHKPGFQTADEINLRYAFRYQLIMILGCAFFGLFMYAIFSFSDTLIKKVISLLLIAFFISPVLLGKIYSSKNIFTLNFDGITDYRFKKSGRTYPWSEISKIEVKRIFRVGRHFYIHKKTGGKYLYIPIGSWTISATDIAEAIEKYARKSNAKIQIKFACHTLFGKKTLISLPKSHITTRSAQDSR